MWSISHKPRHPLAISLATVPVLPIRPRAQNKFTVLNFRFKFCTLHSGLSGYDSHPLGLLENYVDGLQTVILPNKTR